LPLLVASIGLSGAALFVNETWLLGATREFDRIHHRGNEVTYERDSFWYHRGRSFYHVSKADEEKGMLRDVTVYQLDERGRLIESLRSQRVKIQPDGRWLMKNAVRFQFDPATPDVLPTRKRLESTLVDASSRSTLALMDARENSLTLRELRDVVDARTSDDRNALRFRAMIHSRLATPLSVFLFALIGVPLGLSVERTRSIAVSALYGLAAIALFHASWRTGTLMARSGFELAAFAPWAVLSVFSVVGAILMVRTPR
jgi:lipopolysaccharide export LptBFGC system permease protein LptF